MNAADKKATLLEKENVAGLQFPEEEVLNSQEAIKQRMFDLVRATTLGNIEHGKIKIIFEDACGLKAVETTIWGITDKQIILKRGVVIPINRICEVRI